MTDKPITLTAQQLAARHSEADKARAFEWLRALVVADGAPSEAGIVLDTYAALADRALNATAQGMVPAPLDELRATICAIGIVGQIDGKDVVYRDSVIEMIDRRRAAIPSLKAKLEAAGIDSRHVNGPMIDDTLSAAPTAPIPAVDAVAGEPVAWYEVQTPGADFDVSFVQTMEEALQLNEGDPDAASYITPLYEHPAPRAGSETTASASVQGAPDMRAICEALGFDPTNHHNAAKCPYCRPAQGVMGAEVVAQPKAKPDGVRS